ncbi:hypothetical protein EXU11_06505 [Klebsiella quasipneumoniae subsp. quasipneumoniae]|nr:hypothetical protein EXU05_03355 [Klebsiella quasipneumoniae subsp. quasipneumoniae]TBP76563.1 hypothetical protein EXT99_02165 [Klebsiella quasipneumoniae subsp. quasipneumoniae]TBQ01707.1 hypothetical protein EXU07_18590 [Klebsiella quasipneumoniae subsp. quasipneumoniae]TBQ69590.1 hypothetical protein EXU11_06505 [Klebsiella quasipneumoniae subsp. quasipneumoniae]
MVLLRIFFPLNPCFVLWTSRSHTLPVGGKEEKILIYNEKELNKPVGILYALVAFYRRSHDSRAALFPSGERVRVTGPGVICASQDCKFGINISRARPTVVEIDPGDSLPDRGENESGIVATVNGLAGFFVQR